MEDEAIADNADIRPIAQDLAQTAEEFGAIPGELLDLVDERQIEPLTEFDDLPLLVFDLGLRRVERRCDPRQLVA